MPIYEYVCPICGKIEVLQTLNDEELKFCPTCESEVEKIFSVPAKPRFKGTGFYETDYKNRN